MTGAASAHAPVARDIFEEFVVGFFSPVAELFEDSSVSEIMINGPDRVFVERAGQLSLTPCSFASEGQLMSALRAVAQFLGRPLDGNRPILEGRLPDGSRLQAVLPPLVSGGPIVAIRRHRTDNLDIQALVRLGAISDEAVQFLRTSVERKQNTLVSGGTGSGKTSLLRCIASLIPSVERIVTIEDARELSLQQDHVVSLEARPPDDRGQGAILIGDLFVATLRLRPDRIVIGELRGGEALDLIQAMTSGHGGCLSTVHASSPDDALRRLETMALYRGLSIPLPALRAQIASAVDLVVQVERTASGKRWVSTISRVLPSNDEVGYRVHPVFCRTDDGTLSRKEGANG